MFLWGLPMRFGLVPVLTVIGLLLASCHTIKEDLPTRTPASPSLQVTIIPPSGTPGATPTPTPTPPPASNSCKLGEGPGNGENCVRLSENFLVDVDDAINAVVQEHPAWFNRNDQNGTGGYLVLDVPAFHDAVVAKLEASGLCAEFDGEEIGVKSTNDWNDQYDIILSDNHIRRGDGSYRSTCKPAAF